MCADGSGAVKGRGHSVGDVGLYDHQWRTSPI